MSDFWSQHAEMYANFQKKTRTKRRSTDFVKDERLNRREREQRSKTFIRRKVPLHGPALAD